MGGVRKTGSFTKIKISPIKNFAPELRATLYYRVWLLAVGYWLLAIG